MEFSITGISKVTMEHKKGEPKSTHVATDMRLEISEGMDRKMYLDENDLPTQTAIKHLTQSFIQGLVCNIHMAHQKGWWDSAEHIRYIISELKRGFVQVATVGESTM